MRRRSWERLKERKGCMYQHLLTIGSIQRKRAYAQLKQRMQQRSSKRYSDVVRGR